MMSVDAELSRISGLPQNQKTSAYLSLLSSTLSAPTSPSLIPSLRSWLSTVSASDFPQIVARQVLEGFAETVNGKVEDRETRKEVLRVCTEVLQGRATSFEDLVCTLREQYADLLEEDEEFPEAAKVLIGIPLESGTRSAEYKLKIYIRIVRLFLEEEDSTSADTYFNRASLLANATKDLETQLQFKLCQARMFDFSRRFSDAASKYHEISYQAVLDEGDRLQALAAAIVCAVLAPAGPVRSRLLASLYRDDRTAHTPHHTILTRTFLDQMIRPAEVSSFAAALQPHQLAKLPPTQAVVIADDAEVESGKKGPETVLDRAMMEHNVLAASRVYNNITFRGLGLLLGLRPSAAEAMARTMIQQRRLKASIDQIDQLILFDVSDKGGEGDNMVSNVAQQLGAAQAEEEGGGREEEANAPGTKRWDAQIRQTLQLAEQVAARCEVLLAEGVPATTAGTAVAAA
ncbi:hypothetical protein JCM8547_002188 [Rhodosporidiobolus lusitaniae]